MNVLYHGSRYKNNILKPGFNYSNKEINWDSTESNKNLYVTENKESAILMGIAGLLEKNNTLKEFSISDKIITIEFYPNESKVSIDKNDEIYLYTIKPLPNQKWIKVNNKNNKDFSEFKTTDHIQYDRIEPIIILDWLKKNGYSLNYCL